MIRRPTIDASGQPAWLLITQTQHATLAGWLAQAWRLADVPPAFRPDLVWTAAHHDDGWQQWEDHPELDERGWPIGFMDMSVEQSNPLWAHSIDLAGHQSPLAEHLVAWHFLTLRAASGSVDLPAAQQFAEVYRPRSEAALRQAMADYGSVLDEHAVQQLRHFVQLFDVLSLTLCCGALSDPVKFEGIDGQTLVCPRVQNGNSHSLPGLATAPN